MAAAVGPACSFISSPWDVSGGRRAQRAVYARLVDRAASAHPRPLVGGRIEHPKVVEIARTGGTEALSPKEPEMTAAVDPASSVISASRDVSRGRRAQRAVYARMINRAAAAHPHPLVRGWIELPEIVEIAKIARRVLALPSKDPEMAAAVGPAHSIVVASGDVPGGRRSQRAVYASMVDRVASAHPGPIHHAAHSQR